MKKLLLAASLMCLANTMHATKFKVTNNSSQEELPTLFFIYHEKACGKKGALLPHGKTTEIISDKYGVWPFEKECGVKSIEIVTQDKQGKQRKLFAATADQLEAHAMKALSTEGQKKGWKSSGDRYTGYFVIDMQDFDVDLV
ncbi:MAG: hypothetical protein ACHQVS_05420 [Candidatus Babeliales bacterium]